MSSNNISKSDLMRLHNVIQYSMISYPKQVIIETLRDFFSKDSYYHYVKDEWGFTKTPDHTNLDREAGLNDNVTTRIFIGENFRYNVIYYPAILVKSNGSRYVPVSFNKNEGTVRYEDTLYYDGYGNNYIKKIPKVFITTGAWEGSLSIDVVTRSLESRDELVQLVAMCFTEIYFHELEHVGIIVKPISISGASETEDRTDKLFRQTLTLDIRTEWKREIPINKFLDKINFFVEFGNLSKEPFTPAQNLTIQTETTLEDVLSSF